MYNFELLALYNNTWGDFDFNATLGGNVYKVNNQTTVTTAQDMQIRDVVALMSFNETSLEQNSYRKQINSVYGAVNVGWNIWFISMQLYAATSRLPSYRKQCICLSVILRKFCILGITKTK
mgnify:CR=1 FL=1